MPYNLPDINDRFALQTLLAKLTQGTAPAWGKMNAQQMVEHLIEQVQYTNGKLVAVCRRGPEEAAIAKQRAIYGNDPIPKNLVLKEMTRDLLHPGLSAAIDALLGEIDLFHDYFSSPARQVVHGGFGPMNYQEWIIWHNKHFAHHFSQFGLLD